MSIAQIYSLYWSSIDESVTLVAVSKQNQFLTWCKLMKPVNAFLEKIKSGNGREMGSDA
jgi:hypothetical protein